MRSWIPVPGTTTGRLVVAALDLFGAQGFSEVSVASIAERAGVTTGSLYHHFGSKAGLYELVRADVEQRVVGRLEGAAARRPVQNVAELGPVLLVGFDYLVSSGFTRLLAESSPEQSDSPGRPDQVERFVAELVDGDGTPMAALIAAVWRAALRQASGGPDRAAGARAALERLLRSS
jgi:AcrR family transcriptional regulator